MEVPYLDREGSSYGPTARGKKTVQTAHSIAYDVIRGVTSWHTPPNTYTPPPYSYDFKNLIFGVGVAARGGKIPSTRQKQCLRSYDVMI